MLILHFRRCKYEFWDPNEGRIKNLMPYSKAVTPILIQFFKSSQFLSFGSKFSSPGANQGRIKSLIRYLKSGIEASRFQLQVQLLLTFLSPKFELVGPNWDRSDQNWNYSGLAWKLKLRICDSLRTHCIRTPKCECKSHILSCLFRHHDTILSRDNDESPE